MRLHRNFQLTDNKKLNAKTQLLRVVKIKFKVQENQRFSILIQTKNAKAIIGTVLPTSPPGILILEDSNKAMVLPKVASPHLNIIKPSAGMMVYDTTSKMFAVLVPIGLFGSSSQE